LSPEERSGNSDYYGPERSINIKRDGAEVPPEDVVCMDLRSWAKPPTGKVGVDVHLGRLTVPEVEAANVALEVSYSYGFSGDLGGGPYSRLASAARWYDPDKRPVTWQIGVTKEPTALSEAAPGQLVDNLHDALDAWHAHASAHPAAFGLIVIMDSRSYEEDLIGAHVIELPPRSRLAIVAAHWPAKQGTGTRTVGHFVPVGLRPHLRGDVSVRGLSDATPDTGALILDGLLVEGALTVLIGDLGELHLRHTTLVPSLGGLTVNASASAGKRNDRLQVRFERSVCGAIRLETVSRVELLDSIVRAAYGLAINARGAALRLDNCTILGASMARSLEASNSLLAGVANVERRQVGCARFSYLPENSLTPKRYRCQPDLVLAQRARDKGSPLSDDEKDAIRARVNPFFTSEHYNDPAYAQLRMGIASEILSGAENGAEMGAFNFLMRVQREANLRQRLAEYLPFGLEAGLYYVT
jgi:hypothetical protein